MRRLNRRTFLGTTGAVLAASALLPRGMRSADAPIRGGMEAVSLVIGAVVFLQKLRISPDAAFSANDWTAFVIFIVVIGGIGTLYMIALGVVAIVIMPFAPRGLWGVLRDRWGLELFPLSRRVSGLAEKEA